MKTIAAIFFSVLVGFAIGRSLGRFLGSWSGGAMGALDGICAVADAAVAAKVLPSDQAEKLGLTQAQTIKVSAQKAQDYLNNGTRKSDACRRIVTGIVQAKK